MGERKLICTIDINDMIDINAADYIIKDIKSKASNEQRQFPIILRNCKWLDSDIVSVEFMVSEFELENYCDFSVDNEGLGHASVYATEKNIKEIANNERRIIAIIKKNYDLVSRIFNDIIKNLKKCARTDESTFINTIKFMRASGRHIQVKFLVPIYTLDKYYDFFIDDESLGGPFIYARKKHECLEARDMFYESNKILIEKETEELAKTIAEAGNELPAVNEETEDNEKDFEYICDRCGVKVKTPNTLRGPVNVVDFYREVEDEVGDSVSYRLCQECMQDFFGFLSCN